MKKSIMIVGEAWGEHEELAGKAFTGPAGQVLNGLLHQTGIARSECYSTNVFNFRPLGGDIKNLCGTKAEGLPGYPAIVKSKYILKKHQSELDRLYAEIYRVNPNVILALGNTPLWALCKRTGIKKHRGAPLSTAPLPPPPHMDATPPRTFKVIPTWPPAAILRQWELRATAYADISKTKAESTSAELKRPSHLLYLEPSLQDIEDFYNEFMIGQPFLSCDIETKAKTITEVGYSLADGSRAIVIPFWSRKKKSGNYWDTLKEEREAWGWVRKFNTEFQLIGQNFSYDMQYFWRSVGIPCPRFFGDTMVMHHTLQPELEKGLGYLATIYTNEPSWKFMRTEHSTLKREDG